MCKKLIIQHNKHTKCERSIVRKFNNVMVLPCLLRHSAIEIYGTSHQICMGESLNVDDVASGRPGRFRNWAPDLGGPKTV